MKAKLLLVVFAAILFLSACANVPGAPEPRSVTTNYVVETRCGSGLGQGSTVNTYAMMNEPQKLKDANGSEYYNLGGPGFDFRIWPVAVNNPKQTITEGYCAVSWDQIFHTFSTRMDENNTNYLHHVTEEEMDRFESFLNK